MLKFIRHYRSLVIAAGAIGGTFILAMTLLIADGLTDDLHPADVAVVLGNKVELNGWPSERLRARLDRAVELYKNGLFPNIIVSGGLGKEGFDEALVMKDYLVSQGVPGGTVLVDSDGWTTSETAKNAAQMMAERDWQSAMVISQYFHMSRSRLAFERQGISPVYTAHAHYFAWGDFYSVPRDTVAYLVYYLRE